MLLCNCLYLDLLGVDLISEIFCWGSSLFFLDNVEEVHYSIWQISFKVNWVLLWQQWSIAHSWVCAIFYWFIESLVLLLWVLFWWSYFFLREFITNLSLDLMLSITLYRQFCDIDYGASLHILLALDTLAYMAINVYLLYLVILLFDLLHGFSEIALIWLLCHSSVNPSLKSWQPPTQQTYSSVPMSSKRWFA